MKVVCLGSGNVATHMAKAFKAAGARVLQVWSREIDHARQLADVLEAEATDDLDKIDRSADLYVISVKDEAIAGITHKLKEIEGLVVHTSGATDINVLEEFRKYGVLYPLQTFSKDKALNFNDVPLCIEASNSAVLENLRSIAKNLSSLVYEVNSEQRKVLHLAAVFACNFTNHLYYVSQLILEKNGLDFDLLKPLIIETAEKVQSAMPLDVQTGPAVRGDSETIKKHIALLQGLPEPQKIYEILSKSIKKTLQ